jgi:6-pyruvoyltetrahydropterin/6-carboxytetrahydropterin synthase
MDRQSTVNLLYRQVLTMAGVYEIYIKTHFSAAHALKGYPGDCARMHGHNWMTEVYVECRKLDEIGIGIDFREIKKAVNDVMNGLDHFNLNDLPAFQNDNPTSENIARYLYKEISKILNNKVVRVSRVKVCETPGAGALYWEE